jgi:hypothetical protein
MRVSFLRTTSRSTASGLEPLERAAEAGRIVAPDLDSLVLDQRRSGWRGGVLSRGRPGLDRQDDGADQTLRPLHRVAPGQQLGRHHPQRPDPRSGLRDVEKPRSFDRQVAAEVGFTVIDLGPEGGDKGGTVVAWGTRNEVARVRASRTAP